MSNTHVAMDAIRRLEVLKKENAAQLKELHRISEALGTNEGHSSVTHIEILKGENAALREQLRHVDKYLLNYPPQSPDYTCSNCTLYSEWLIDGFQCAYHAALTRKEEKK